MSEKLFEKNIKELVEYELKSAIEKHGYFNSYHEFYAILLEEVEESNDECIAINNMMKQIWKEIKKDQVDKYSINKLRIYVEQNIKELIQVLAVIDKVQITKRDKE